MSTRGNPTGAVCFFGSHENGPGWIFFKSKPCDFFSDMIEHLNKVLKPSPPFSATSLHQISGVSHNSGKKKQKDTSFVVPTLPSFFIFPDFLPQISGQTMCA